MGHITYNWISHVHSQPYYGIAPTEQHELSMFTVPDVYVDSELSINEPTITKKFLYSV